MQPDTLLQPDAISPSMATSGDSLLARARGVIDVEVEALEGIKQRLDEGFVQAVTLIRQCRGRVIVTGMGKSGIIGKKIAATLSSTGTPAYFLHPAEGTHGDSGVMMKEDVVIAISNSGETPEILSILPVIKRFGLPLIAMTGKKDSTLGKRADVVLDVGVSQEACPMGLAPTASTTATLAMGDALAVVLLEIKGFTQDDFAMFHPSGSLGKKLLLKVEDLMHVGEAIPRVSAGTGFLEALMEITGKKLGMTLVETKPDENQTGENQTGEDFSGKLLGILTDGDVRRALTQYSNVRDIVLENVMTRSPKTIEPEALAVSALSLMETHKITVLLVADGDGKIVGVLHMHDILKAGIA